MNVTMRCQDHTATLFRGGEPVSGAPYSYMYTIPFVQPDDEAEFECRSGSSVVAHNRSRLSVQGIPLIIIVFMFFSCCTEQNTPYYKQLIVLVTAATYFQPTKTPNPPLLPHPNDLKPLF